MYDYELQSRANWKRFLKKVFLKISQNSESELKCRSALFLIKLQAWGLQL